MGVECDEASYHSAKSVRDRDRLRQVILERLGWRIRRIRRIWSTDWYKNPEAQLGPIIRELNALKTEKAAVPAVKSEEEGIEAIEKRIQKKEQAPGWVAGGGALRQRLLQFDQDVLRKSCPYTPDNERLLRPAMLEALLQYQPTSKWEFLETIPAYLRHGTNAEEGKYLAQALEIIDDAEQKELE